VARKPTVVTDKQSSEVTPTFPRVEAQALLKAAETGLKVAEALALVQNTAAMEEAIRKLRAAT
jgi:hypothetical protein